MLSRVRTSAFDFSAMSWVTLGTRGAAVFVGAALAPCALAEMTASPAPVPPSTIVRQIDHLLLTSSQAQELFALLTETFQLPVVWPLTDYGSFGSGGVALGNVNLEVIKAPAPATHTAGSRFAGLALEPEPLQTSLRELAARHIPHGKPGPFRSRQPNGSFATLWTTVALPEVSGDALEVFICEYTHDVPARRRRFLEKLRSRGGGPLSVDSVREIVIGAQDMKQTEARWQKLLQPLQASGAGGAWRLGAGPAIRVIAADQDELREVIVAVTSLEQARRFLKQQGLLGPDRHGSLTVATARLPGFSLTLVEQPPRLGSP